MADQIITERPIKQQSGFNLNSYLLGLDADSYRILISDLAKKIVEDYSGSTLAGSAQAVKTALDSIDSTIGNTAMGTTATTITGAIAEHESDISTLNSKTALSNVKYLGDDRHVRYRRTGNICIVEVEGYTVASTGNLSLGTLPVEDRPLTTAQAILKIGTSPVSGWITQSSGVVYVSAPTTGNLAGEFVFFVE